MLSKYWPATGATHSPPMKLSYLERSFTLDFSLSRPCCNMAFLRCKGRRERLGVPCAVFLVILHRTLYPTDNNDKTVWSLVDFVSQRSSVSPDALWGFVTDLGWHRYL